jgi:dynein heavy chain
VALSTMKASRFYETFKTQIDYWEHTLALMSEVIEMILTVQRQWMCVQCHTMQRRRRLHTRY